MTPTPASQDEIDQLARRRVGAKLGWYLHASVYVLVNVALFMMSQHGFGVRPWRLFPLFGWGIGLALHGIAVWLLGSGLRERMVEDERERLLRQRTRRESE
jgi:hypothetical protein